MSNVPLAINECFMSYQGEGNSIGQLAYFVRLQGCNLDPPCYFCDTSYAQDMNSKATIIMPKEIANRIARSKARRVVITGGEPLLQAEGVADLVDELLYHQQNRSFYIEIETNGTLLEMATREDAIHHLLLQATGARLQLNVSPKLHVSDEYNLEERMIAMRRLPLNVIYKFVVGSKEDITEAALFVGNCGLPPNQVYLMPQGATRDEQLELLPMVIAAAKLRGYNLGLRAHVLIWNNERGV